MAKLNNKLGIAALAIASANMACSSLFQRQSHLELDTICREEGIDIGKWKTEFGRPPNMAEESSTAVNEALSELRKKHGDAAKYIMSACISETIQKPVDLHGLMEKIPELSKISEATFKLLMENPDLTSVLIIDGKEYNEEEIERIKALVKIVKEELLKVPKTCQSKGIYHVYSDEPGKYDDRLLASELPASKRMLGTINGREDFLWGTGSEIENERCDEELAACLKVRSQKPNDEFIIREPFTATFAPEPEGKIPNCDPPKGTVPKDLKIAIKGQIFTASQTIGLNNTADLIQKCLNVTTYNNHHLPRNTGKLVFSGGLVGNFTYDRTFSFVAHPEFQQPNGPYFNQYNQAKDELTAAQALWVCLEGENFKLSK